MRFGEKDKLLEPCKTSFVLAEAVKPFLAFAEISRVIIATDGAKAEIIGQKLSDCGITDDRVVFCDGGASRTKTVINALKMLDGHCKTVLIHDGARPYVTPRTISAVIDGARQKGASLPLLALTDALVRTGEKTEPVDRSQYRRVQTPAGFERNRLISAYSMATEDFYDDISVVLKHSEGEVAVIDGDENNVKITSKEDLKTPLVGCGYDVHRLVKGEGLRLLGVDIPCPYSFVAHSDGDVAIHALMDAILSALGKKDIGHYFPVDDARYDGIDSTKLLKEVLDVMGKDGYAVSNCAVAVIAEKPVLSPYIDRMKTVIAALIGVTSEKVGITATTNERVGDIGDGNAIAAYATVQLV